MSVSFSLGAAGDAEGQAAGVSPLLQVLPEHAGDLEHHGRGGAEQSHALRIRQLDGGSPFQILSHLLAS